MASTYPMGFPTKYFGWKGKPFFQVIASIQRNLNNAPNLSVKQLRKPLPLKIYRKEIVPIRNQTLPKSCNVRTSTKIFDFESPGNNIVSTTQSALYSSNGLVDTLDINPTTLSGENGACNTPTACMLSPQLNARRRCRSSGMMPRKFNTTKNNDQYSSSTQQYLTSRNRTIKQNEYNYIRKGDAGMIPGPGLAASNIYSPAGLSHCAQVTISPANNNNVINYYWIDKTAKTATIPTGAYDVNSLNAAFQAQQIINNTYLTDANNNKIFLLNISYDTRTQTVVLIANVASNTSYPKTLYSDPAGFLNGVNYPANDPTTSTSGFPIVFGATNFTISQNNNFGAVIGFAPGTYALGVNKSAFLPQITSNYVTLYYKPNNPGFGVQGAVDSSTLIQRVKYNTITDAASSLRSPYGNAAANALSYGASEEAYTIKSAVGDKPIFSPVINPRTGQLCKKRIIYRM